MTTRPNQRWLLLVALDEEMPALADNLSSLSKGSWQDHQWIRGIMGASDILATVTGVGKVHAAMTTQHWIDAFNPQAVFVLGLAGSLSSKLKHGDFVIGKTLIQHDIIAHPAFPPRCIPRADRKTVLYEFHSDKTLIDRAFSVSKSNLIHSGTIVTGDHFITDDLTKKQQLVDEFNAVAVDMESAAIAQVCHIHNIPLLVVQTISDSADDQATQDFNEFLPTASQQVAQFVEAFFHS